MTVLDKRKTDHIELAVQAQLESAQVDGRFYYEPLFGHHPKEIDLQCSFLGKKMGAPLWVSSMTGGTGPARHINQNLAQAVKEFGLGMGLGSCRSLLESETYFEDFNLRPILGKEVPFYANIGIVQVDELLKAKEIHRLEDLLERLDVDGIFVHLNPLQEWFQPEGDFLERSSLSILEELLTSSKMNVIVKEVGQGMGPKSLKALMSMPLAAIEFSAFGGTNFSKLEMLRDHQGIKTAYGPLAKVGHTACDMVLLANEVRRDLGGDCLVNDFIISGGVRDFLDGYYLTSLFEGNAVYGQAKALLEQANQDYQTLQTYIRYQLLGLSMAKQFLTLRSSL